MKSLLQFVKFGLVGLSNTAISYGIYVILVRLGVYYLFASVAGFVVSVLNSFYWNNRYVFQDKAAGQWWKKLIRTFLSYAGTGLVLSNILLYIWVEFVHLNEMIAPVVNLVITVPLNFVINKYWAFGEKRNG
ncbi:MAG: GtrA family protein [Alistipes sp.]|nr:GtrA family protein [Alistipes sp.]